MVIQWIEIQLNEIESIYYFFFNVIHVENVVQSIQIQLKYIKKSIDRVGFYSFGVIHVENVMQ